MIIARQSTARTVTVGPVLDADGVAVTGGVVGDLKISKNGGNPAALNGSATLTHRHTGFYSLVLTTSDLDTVGQAEIVIDDTVNSMPMKEITVIEEAVYDALYAASALGYVANAPVNVAQFGGSNGTFSSGRPEVNTTHLAGTSQTARDIGASVLLSSGTGTGQLKLASGYVAMTWADIAAPTTTVNLSGTTIATTQKVDVETIKTNPVVNAGTVTFPTTATLASTTNITAGTLTTVTTATNLTNAATAGDFTATMKTSIGTAVAASAVASVTGSVGGNVTGSVGSIASGGITEASFATTAGSFAPLQVIDQGTAQAVTGTTIRLRSAAAFADDELIGARVLVASATTGAGQSRLITDYVSATDTATVDTWTTTPTGTVTYKVFSDTAAAGGSAPSAATVADAVWDELLSGHVVSGSAGEILGNVATGTPPTAAAIADAVWDEATSGHTTSGTFGEQLKTDVDAIITTLGTPGLTSVSADIAAVQSAIADDVLSAIQDVPTVAEFEARTIVSANYATAANQSTALTAIGDLPTNAELATALGTADDAVLTQVALVKAKTDQLTFTVTNQVDANTKSMNDAEVQGDGTSGDKWRGV